MTLPDSAIIDQNAETHPAGLMQQRVGLLAAQHPWMPADMQTTLAGASTSNNQMISIANSIKNSLASTWNGFTEATDDNVLHKQPTAALALTRMINSSLGPLPVAAPDLTAVQNNLIKQGFGKGLEANGVWGADWNDAYAQWSNELYNKQIAGDEPGSTTTGNAGHSIFDALIPSHALNAVVGFAKSLPGDVRDLTANVIGSAVNTVADPESYSLHASKANQAASPGAKAATEVERLLGNSQAQQKVSQEIAHPNASLLQDVGTVLALYPIAGQGSAAARAAQGELERGVTLEAAQRGPGVIAKSFGGLSTETIKNAGEEDLERNAVRRGVLNSRVARNIPILRQLGPVTGHLADADGAYYRIRTLLATPYAVPGVRIAGDIGQRTLLTGAGLRLGAQAAQGIAGPSDLTNSILNNNTTDDIDRNLDRIAGTPGAKPFTDFVNAMGFVLHGPLGDTANSEAIGNAVDAGRNVTSHAFGQYGAEGAWERAVTAATGEKTSVEDLHKAFGSEDLADRFLTMKINEMGAAHGAQKLVQSEDGLQFGADGYRAAADARENELWGDPGQHIAAMREVTASKDSLQARLFADMVDAGIRGGRKQTLDEYVKGAKNWMDAGGHVTAMIRNGDASALYGANGQTAIRTAQDAFDFGYGEDNPVRLLDTTRRQYVQQTTRLLNRVSKGVDKARTITGKDTADAQKAMQETEAALGDQTDDEDLTTKHGLAKLGYTAAKQRQARIESAISSGRLDRMANIMKDSPQTKSTSSEWDQLAKDHRDFKNLIQQTAAPGEEYNLPNILEHGIDPDALYSRVNGEPRTPNVAPGSSEWIKQNLNLPAGGLGLANIDSKSIQQATADIARLLKTAVTAQPDDREAAMEAMRNYAFTELGLDARTLKLYDDPQRLSDVMSEHADQLHSDVFLPPDASQRLKSTVAKINDAGYKLAMGSHIGHIWDGSLVPVEDLKGAVQHRRKVTDLLGLGVNAISGDTKSLHTQKAVLREVDRVLHDGETLSPPRYTAETVIHDLRDKEILPPTLKLPEKLIYTATSHVGLHPALDELAKGVGEDEARRQYEGGIADAQIRDLPRKKVQAALVSQGFGERDANKVYRAIQRGYGDRPNSMFGLSSLEDHFRSGFYVLDKLATKFDDSGALGNAVQALADAPNNLIQLRNRLRFDLSFMFDARRAVKTNLKMAFDGVVPSWTPLQHMISNGTFNKAHQLLDEIQGTHSLEGADNADRYLNSQSVWGLFNERHTEAYYVWEKHMEGASNDEIRDGLRRVFAYGSTKVDGRTPLESSVNTLFFPFSFEKNLLRNTGSYLLNHPQQALLLTGAMEAYRNANQNEQITQWSQDHLPLLKDMQKLNGFAHGISLGQPGGINAPLLNLFLPQIWGSGMTESNVKESIPAWKDIGSLVSDSTQQAEIAKNALLNARDYAINLGKPRSPFDPYRPTITPQAQRRDAEVMRNNFITQLAPILSANVHRSAANKITWPDNPALPPGLQGRSIDRTTIGDLVKRWYPAYDPAFSQAFAVEQSEKSDQAIADLARKNPAQAAQWGVLVKLANSTQTHLNDNTIDTEQAAQVMTQFRTLAVAAAESEPGFLDFYNAHFKYLFGPIESVNP